SSRAALPDSTLAMLMETLTLESARRSAMVTEPVTSVNLPRTLVTMKWRPMNARSVCPGSMSHRPEVGRSCPSMLRVGDAVSRVGVLDMVMLLSCWCGVMGLGGGLGRLGRVAGSDPALDAFAVLAHARVAEALQVVCHGLAVAAGFVGAVGDDRGVLVGQQGGRLLLDVGLDEVERARQVDLVVVRGGQGVDDDDVALGQEALELGAGNGGGHDGFLYFKCVRTHISIH